MKLQSGMVWRIAVEGFVLETLSSHGDLSNFRAGQHRLIQSTTADSVELDFGQAPGTDDQSMFIKFKSPRPFADLKENPV